MYVGHVVILPGPLVPMGSGQGNIVFCRAHTFCRDLAVYRKHLPETGNSCGADTLAYIRWHLGPASNLCCLAYTRSTSLLTHSLQRMHSQGTLPLPVHPTMLLPAATLWGLLCRILPGPRCCCCCYRRLCSWQLNSPLLSAKHPCSPKASRSRRTPGLLVLQPLYAIRCALA